MRQESISAQQRIGSQVNIPLLMRIFLPAWFISSWFLPALCPCLHLATMSPIMMVIALSLCVTNSKVVLSCSHAAFTPPSLHLFHSSILLGLSSPGLFVHGVAGSVFCMAPSGGIGRSLPSLSGSTVSLQQHLRSVTDRRVIHSQQAQQCIMGVSSAVGTFVLFCFVFCFGLVFCFVLLKLTILHFCYFSHVYYM